jgi:hypothetical protein
MARSAFSALMLVFFGALAANTFFQCCFDVLDGEQLNGARPLVFCSIHKIPACKRFDLGDTGLIAGFNPIGAWVPNERVRTQALALGIPLFATRRSFLITHNSPPRSRVANRRNHECTQGGAPWQATRCSFNEPFGLGSRVIARPKTAARRNPLTRLPPIRVTPAAAEPAARVQSISGRPTRGWAKLSRLLAV